MKRQSYQVRELARLAGVSVRTLHHYDRIGLLRPARRTPAGYREYGEAEVLRLQQILLHREQGFPLEAIRGVLETRGVDRRELLREQRERLLQEADSVAARLRSVEAALAHLEGEDMNAEIILQGFQPEEYAAEARDRWGASAAYQEAARRTQGYSESDWAELKAEVGVLLEDLASLLDAGESPESPAARELAEAHRLHMERWFYPCSHARHRALTDLYQGDPRFAATFEAVRTGLTEFLVRAIEANASRPREEEA